METKTSIIKPYTKFNNDIYKMDLNVYEQSLLITLISFYNTSKGYAYPSYKKLKERSRIKHPSTFANAKDSLVEKGLITKIETITGIGNKYYLNKNILLDYNLSTYAEKDKVVSKKSKNKYPKECIEVINYFNSKTGQKYRTNSKEAQSFIIPILEDNFTVQDMKRVIDIKTGEWLNSAYQRYLTFETLFGKKFEKYLNQQQTLTIAAKKPKSKAFDFATISKDKKEEVKQI